MQLCTEGVCLSIYLLIIHLSVYLLIIHLSVYLLIIHLSVYLLIIHLSVYLLQLLGVAIRADMPISLDLLPSFWKSLKKERLDLSDLREADCITYNLTQKMLDVSVCV